MTFAGNIKTGEFILNGLAQQLPDILCRQVTIKARSTNGNLMFVGTAGVTAADGTLDTTTGFELNKSEEVTLEVQNMKQIWVIGTATQGLTYLAIA